MTGTDLYPLGVTCPACGTKLVIVRPDVLEAVGNLKGPEAELSFIDQLATAEAQTGDRLAVLDAERGYACPECGERGQLPPEDELRRLAQSD